MNLDIRDLAFWFREAQKKLIREQLKAIQAARLAVAGNNDYKMVTTELEKQLRELDLGKKKVIKENWEELKLMRKKK